MNAAVVARPDPKWGETPCAFLELKPGATQPDDAEVIAFCRERMARFKVPKTLIYGPCPGPRPARFRNSRFAIERSLCEDRRPARAPDALAS